MRMPAGPLLIVGCQRSGTTLLRSILNAHPQISIGFECDFFEVLEPTYGRLPDIRPHLDRYLNDLFAVRRFDYWGLTASDIRRQFARTPGAVAYDQSVRLICDAHRARHKPDAALTGLKNPNSIERLDRFFHLFPGGRVIHIIRDPRGVAASQKSKLIRRDGTCDAALTTVQTCLRHRRAMAGQARFANDPRLRSMSYGDLITDTRASLEPLCDWLGLAMDDAMLAYHTQADTPTAELWQHGLTRQPPDPARLSAYRDVLSEVELQAVNFLCRAALPDWSDGARTEYRMTRIAPFLAGGWLRWLRAGAGRRAHRLLHRPGAA